jgi:hypothetical protein
MRMLAIFRVTSLAAMVAISVPAMADPAPMGLPDFPIEKTCSLFTGHPRPLALCQDIETRYRAEVTGSWTRTPGLGREQCTKLAGQSERGKYEVLARCLRAAISEAAWKDAVGTIKQ